MVFGGAVNAIIWARAHDEGNGVLPFVDLAVTENRLEQGLEYLAEMGHAIEMRSTGPFLQWVGQDVKRECRAELEASDLEWKQVGKAVNRKALEFFKARVQAL